MIQNFAFPVPFLNIGRYDMQVVSNYQNFEYLIMYIEVLVLFSAKNCVLCTFWKKEDIKDQ